MFKSDMEVGQHLQFKDICQAMQDERNKNLPILPHYLDQFATTIKEFSLDESLVATLRSGDGTALLFSNEELLQSLLGAKRLVFETLYSVKNHFFHWVKSHLIILCLSFLLFIKHLYP